MTGRRLSLGILASLGVLALGAWAWRAIGAGRGGAPAGPAIAIEATIAEIEAGRKTTPLMGEPTAAGECDGDVPGRRCRACPARRESCPT